MSALSRELGSRGRADAVVTGAIAEPEPHINDLETPATDSLRSELGGLRLKALLSRARADGVDADSLEDAMDNDDPKQAVIELIVQQASSNAGAGQDALRRELSGLRLKELRARAKGAGVGADELEEATDADDPKAATIEMLLRANR